MQLTPHKQYARGNRALRRSYLADRKVGTVCLNKMKGEFTPSQIYQEKRRKNYEEEQNK